MRKILLSLDDFILSHEYQIRKLAQNVPDKTLFDYSISVAKASFNRIGVN
jgi:hypothetical protein